MSENIRRLEQAIHYSFNDKDLLKQALSHRSYSKKNNERLEFLGDAILNCTIAQALYDKFPKAKEGQLSRLRAHLVKGETLAEIAREFDLGDHLLLGSGELKSGGFRRDSILADAIEAIIGAISLDKDFQMAQQTLLGWYHVRLGSLSVSDNIKDSKTRLQEYLQARKLPLPDYQVIRIQGEAHEQQFTVECRVSGIETPLAGIGTSRRFAEQEAAFAALQALGEAPSGG